jgi:hypothetical protein
MMAATLINPSFAPSTKALCNEGSGAVMNSVMRNYVEQARASRSQRQSFGILDHTSQPVREEKCT